MARRSRPLRSGLRALIVGVLLAIGCVAAFTTQPARAESPLRVVATFSILADFAQTVGGPRVAVTTLVGAGSDPHVYAPRPADVLSIREADVLIENGFGYESWMERLMFAASFEGVRVVASDGVEPREAGEDDHGHKHNHGDADGVGVDPHAWLAVPNVVRYIQNIRDGFCKADAAGCADYTANAERYTAQLDALDKTTMSALAKIDRKRRAIVVPHNALSYFGARYGLDIYAPQGLSTDAQPSARDVANLIRLIRKRAVGALFVEARANPGLIEQISRETQVGIGGLLFFDTLTEAEGPAPTYIKLIEHNTSLITEALGRRP